MAARRDGTLFTNQFAYQAFLNYTAILAELRHQGMFLSAYSPLANGQVARAPDLRKIAKRVYHRRLAKLKSVAVTQENLMSESNTFS